MPDDSRREFLRFGLSGFGALSLPALYRLVAGRFQRDVVASPAESPS